MAAACRGYGRLDRRGDRCARHDLFALGEEPATVRVVYILLVLIPVAGTLYTVLRSRRLWDFLQTLAEEHRTSKKKLGALLAIFKGHARTGFLISQFYRIQL